MFEISVKRLKDGRWHWRLKQSCNGRKMAQSCVAFADAELANSSAKRFHDTLISAGVACAAIKYGRYSIQDKPRSRLRTYQYPTSPSGSKMQFGFEIVADKAVG